MASTASKSRDEKQMIQQDQIAELRTKQSEGIDKLPTVTANRNPKYQIREDEADRYVIVMTTIKHVSTQTKSVNEEKRMIHIHKAEFQRKIDEQYFAIYDEVEVIHDPRQNAPTVYELKHKDGVVKLDTPKTKETGNAQLNERVQALKTKEKFLSDKEAELIAKQKELEQREAALAGPSKPSKS
jgi:hypothetical protein